MIEQADLALLVELRRGAQTFLGYVDQNMSKDKVEQTALPLRRAWSTAFGKTYDIYPAIQGSRLTNVYYRSFSLNGKLTEIIEHMTVDGRTQKVDLWLQGSHREMKTFAEAEEKAVEFLKGSELVCH